MRKIFTLLLVLCSLFSFSQSTTLVISQIYGGGGNTGATYNADFVELHNISNASVSLAGFSIQYGAATVTTAWSGVYALPSVAVPAGGYYLIQMSAAGTSGAALPSPNTTATTPINMSGNAGRVALVNGTTALVGCPAATAYIDLVGFGATVTCFEGAGAAPAQVSTTADFRKNNSCLETNNNSTDFEVLNVLPRNSSTTAFICGGAPAPTLSASTLAPFGNVCINTTAGPNSFTLTAANLTAANITAGALAGYTYSTTSGGTYTSSLNLTQPGGSYSQQIFVKFTPTAVQSYAGNISVAGGGVSSFNAAASGFGVNTSTTVTSGATSAITVSTATVAGSITVTGCAAITSYGTEYSTTNGFPTGTGTQAPSSNLSGGNFSSNLTGLTANTTYYYHTYVVTGSGTVYGAQMSFTTAVPATPTLSVTAPAAFGNVCINTTTAANSFTITGSNLTAASITVGPLAAYSFSIASGGTYTTSLNLTQTGGSYSQTIFVKFTPTAVQSYNGNIPVSGGGAAPAGSTVTGAGINTSASVTTGAASAVGQTTATAAGTITSSGCSAVVSYGIGYSTINGFANGSGTAVASLNLAANNFTSNFTGLALNTTYYYHAYAANGGAIAYGAQQSFTTSGAVLTATTLAGFGSVCLNTASVANSFTITSNFLSSANINVGPMAGYSFSTSATGTFNPSLSITQPGGAFSQTIFVKFTPTAVQNFNGNIPVTGGGATSPLNVAATGAGINTGASVTTGDATNITMHSAALSGSVTSAGCGVITSFGIEYGTIAGLANGTGFKVKADTISGGNFTVQANNLVQNAKYYYRAYAITGTVISYGAEKSFTTKAIPAKGAGLVIYNNPIAPGGKLHFSIDSILPANYIITIVNSGGSVVYSKPLSTQLIFIDNSINLPAQLPRGMYILNLRNTNDGGFYKSRRFMIL